jgi:hypothetical protein
MASEKVLRHGAQQDAAAAQKSSTNHANRKRGEADGRNDGNLPFVAGMAPQ